MAEKTAGNTATRLAVSLVMDGGERTGLGAIRSGLGK